MLTAVQHITRTAAMSNFQSIPTDCPQRERRGWLGDAQLSCETNFHNFDMAGPYTSFVQQMEDSQGPAGDIQDCVPWWVCRCGGVGAALVLPRDAWVWHARGACLVSSTAPVCVGVACERGRVSCHPQRLRPWVCAGTGTVRTRQTQRGERRMR